MTDAAPDAPVLGICVDPARIEELWPHIEEMVGTVYDGITGDDTPESIKADLMAVRSLLWIVWDGETILAAATTKIISTSRRQICFITSLAGKQLYRWKHFIVDLENYARETGCDVIRFYGRHGWRRVFAEYTQPFIALEKELR